MKGIFDWSKKIESLVADVEAVGVAFDGDAFYQDIFKEAMRNLNVSWGSKHQMEVRVHDSCIYFIKEGNDTVLFFDFSSGLWNSCTFSRDDSEATDLKKENAKIRKELIAVRRKHQDLKDRLRRISEGAQ